MASQNNGPIARTVESAAKSLLKEWDYEKNDVIPSEIGPGSDKRVWWICDEGHSWQASVSYRVKGFGHCIACRSIAFLAPHLVDEWDYEKNEKSPWEIRTGSGQKVWWIGRDCKHSWQTEARARVRNNFGCPYCSGSRVLAGFNDLATTHPNIAMLWDFTRNDISPKEVSAGSHVKVWWKCLSGHSWENTVLNQTDRADPSCLVCKSVAVRFPDLLEEWDDDNDPYEVLAGSDQRIQWKCRKDERHIWTASVSGRTLSGQGCPCCSGRRVVEGETDAKTTHPHLIDEWDDPRDLTEFSRGSSYKARWRCRQNDEHTWTSTISDKTSGKSNCPHCANSISCAEQELTDYISSLGFSPQRDRSILNGKELDIYISEKSLAVEYNGLYWHSEARGKDRLYHYEKWKQCKDLGIQLITVWEDDYRERPDLVRRMLAHKLGRSGEKRIPARKTEVAEVSKDEARLLYDEHHIQGHKDGTHIGLRDKDTHALVAVSTWREDRGRRTVYLDRFATSCLVPGGFSKLLKSAVKKFSEEAGLFPIRKFDQIVTFSDNTVSNGKLYEKNGFVLDKILNPDYTYLVGNERRHKFGYRLKRFREDPTLEYREGMTEKQLAELNGLPRIWDCGKVRYRLDLP